MQYLGGKVKLAKHLYPVMRDDIERMGSYWEPFVGGGGMLVYVAGHAGDHVKMLASDSFIPAVELLRRVGQGWVPPASVTEEFYNEVKNNKDAYPLEVQGFLATACSFAGKPWGGYARQKGYDFAASGSRVLVRDRAALSRAVYAYGDYRGFIPPVAKTAIYCDPPYAWTTGYGGGFDQDAFHAWALEMGRLGHAVYVSGFAHPPGFRVAWQRDRTQHIRRGGVCPAVTELLYVPD